MKYVALLRGVAPMNPNMRNEKFREVFEQLGFKNVQTVIASGNVLFESPSRDVQALEVKIEKTFPKKLGFTSTTIIRNLEQLQKLIKKNPFKGLDDVQTSRFNVTFLRRATKTDLKFPYHAEKKGYTVLGMYDNAVFTVIDLSGSTTADVMLWLEKQFGKEITTRTWRTVMRIVDKLNE